MEPRKWKYHNRRKMNYLKVTFLISIIMMNVVFTYFLNSLPVSYAWFTANKSSKGQIVNATTSDLIKVIPEKIIYGSNRTVKVKLSVQNISNIDIPLKVELIVNNQVLDTSSILLYQKDTFTTGWGKITDFPGDAKDIQFRVVGFQGYINEVITYNIEQEKLMAATTSKDIVNQENTNEEKTGSDDSIETDFKN